MRLFINVYKMRLKSLFQCQKGLAFLEVALTAPILLIMFYGILEVSRAYILSSTVDKTLDSIADVISTFNPQTPGAATVFYHEINQMTAKVPDLMSPFPSTGLYIKLTDYYQTTAGGVPTSSGGTQGWTYTCGDSSTQLNNNILGASATSGGVIIPNIAPQTVTTDPTTGITSDPSNCQDGSASSAVSAPMCQGEEILVGEAFYIITPLIANNGIIGSLGIPVYKNFDFRPRFNDPTTGVSSLPAPPASSPSCSCSPQIHQAGDC